MKIINEQDVQQRPLAAEQRQVRQQELIGRIKPHPGHKVWQFDLATGEITEALFKSVSVHAHTGGQNMVHKSVDTKPNCLYCSALNKKNAIKKFVPMYERLMAGGQITPGQYKPKE